MSDEARQHMLECEARAWLRNGYDTPERIQELRLSISKKRGQASAERLVEEMRRQWRRRAEWLS